MDSYDLWKLETPGEEDERLFGAARSRIARQEYLADHADYFVECERERQEENGR